MTTVFRKPQIKHAPATLALLICLTFTPHATHAGDDFLTTIFKPSEGRLVHRFDFEEAQLNNFETLPISWYAVGRLPNAADPTFLRHPVHAALAKKSGFPRHNPVGFDHPQVQPGPHSLYLGLKSGNTGAFLEAGAIPVLPGSDYLIATRVRTTPLQHARARIVAYFVDQKGARVEPSVAASELVQTHEQWQTIGLHLHGDYPNAASIVIELEALQPDMQPHAQSLIGQRQVHFQDVDGGAWFDDVSVWQLPRVRLSSQTPVNIIVAPEPVRLLAEANDPTGSPMLAIMTLYDNDLQPIAKQERSVPDHAPLNWTWQPLLDHYGWYLIELKVFERTDRGLSDQPIARELAYVLWLPDEATRSDSDIERFGIEAVNLSSDEIDLIPELLKQLGSGSLIMNRWDRLVDQPAADKTAPAQTRYIPMLDERVVIPWDSDVSWQEWAAESHEYALDVPPGVSPLALVSHLHDWSGPPSENTWLRLNQPLSSSTSPQNKIANLVMWMLYSSQAEVGGVTIEHPWQFNNGPTPTLMPDPLLGVYETVSNRFKGRRVIGSLPIDENIDVVVLDGPQGGLVVACKKDPTADQVTLEMFLGHEPAVIDVWGNRWPVPSVNNKHRITVGAVPVFIEGVDINLLKIRLSFKLNQPMVESLPSQRNRLIQFTNPWPYRITGNITITEPTDWKFRPRRSSFSLAPDEQAQLPIQMEFPPSQTMGSKKIIARFEFVRSEDPRPYKIDLSTPLEIGLKDVDLQATLALETSATGNGLDAIVTQIVTNKSQRTQELYSFAALPGYPRQERVISRLAPGESTIKRFRFPGVTQDPDKIKIQVGVRNVSSPAVLNQVLTLPRQ
jgi:hypothetical protein